MPAALMVNSRVVDMTKMRPDEKVGAGLYLASIVGMSVVGGIAAEQYPMAHPTLRLITGDHWPADVVLMVLCASTLYFPCRQMMRAYQKGYYRART